MEFCHFVVDYILIDAPFTYIIPPPPAQKKLQF